MNKDKYYFLINSLEGGGAERVTVNFANNLIKEGKEVYIITLKSSNFYDLPQGVTHISLSNIKNNLLMFLLIPWYVIKFKKTIEKHYLSQGMSLLEIANFVHILSKKNATISFRTHINFFTGLLGFIQKKIIKILYPKAGKIIVNSLENKIDLAEYLDIPENKIEVKYNPIDKEKIAILKVEKIDKNIQEKIKGKKVFITTGRLIEQKHHEKIINALNLLYNTGETERIYLIIGDGPKREKLEKQSINKGLEKNIIFLGTQKNIFKYLAIADIFLYASEVEGFPNVLIEAKEMGLPIITSDFKSGAKEVLLGKYEKNMIIRYPQRTKSGILLDIKNYEKEFIDCYKEINKLFKK